MASAETPGSGKFPHLPDWLKVGVVAPLLVALVIWIVPTGWRSITSDPTSPSARDEHPGSDQEVDPQIITKYRTPEGPKTSGAFEFSVLELECGATRLGEGVLQYTAQGMYCVATVNARNGSQAALLPLVDAVLFVGANSFPGDTTSPGDFYSASVFPGSATRGTIVFDVPAGNQPTAVSLRHRTSTSEARFPLVPL